MVKTAEWQSNKGGVGVKGEKWCRSAARLDAHRNCDGAFEILHNSQCSLACCVVATGFAQLSEADTLGRESYIFQTIKSSNNQVGFLVCHRCCVCVAGIPTRTWLNNTYMRRDSSCRCQTDELGWLAA